MKKRWLMMVPIFFFLDRALKIWAAQDLAHRPGGYMELIPGVLRLRYIENDGAAFSLFAGNSVLLIGLTGLIMLGLLLYLIRANHADKLTWLALATVLGGGLGNLYDRIAYGKVIDYLEPVFVSFAVFNLADVFVVCGAVMAVIGILRADKGRA